MKKLVLAVTLAAAAFLFQGRALAVDLSALPQDLQDKIETMLATRYPPELKKISISPEAPAAGEAVTVSATIYNDSSVTDDEISSVYVLYTTDNGATWNQLEAETEDDKTFKAEIPAQESGTTVIYAIKAVDSSTNFFIDIPCKTESYPTDEALAAACNEQENAAEACAAAMPAGCMMPMSRDDDPLNDEDDIAPPYADFLNYSIGYNDENIFIDLGTEEKTSKGTTSPLDIRANAVAIINRDKDAKGGDLETLLSRGAVIVDAPLASIAGGVVKPCFYGTQKGDGFDQNEKAVKCKMSGKHVLLTLDRASLGENSKTNQFNLFAVDAHITSISPIAGGVFDNNHWTTIHLVDPAERTYTIE